MLAVIANARSCLTWDARTPNMLAQSPRAAYDRSDHLALPHR